MSVYVGTINCTAHGALVPSWRRYDGEERCIQCSADGETHLCPNCGKAMGKTTSGGRRLGVWGEQWECFHCYYHPLTGWTSDQRFPITDGIRRIGRWAARGTRNLLAGGALALYAAIGLFMILFYKVVDWEVGRVIERLYRGGHFWYFWAPLFALLVVGLFYLITRE